MGMRLTITDANRVTVEREGKALVITIDRNPLSNIENLTDSSSPVGRMDVIVTGEPEFVNCLEPE